MELEKRGPGPFGPLTPTARQKLAYPVIHQVVYYYVQNSSDPWDFRCLCSCHDRRIEEGGHVKGYICCPEAVLLEP